MSGSIPARLDVVEPDFQAPPRATKMKRTMAICNKCHHSNEPEARFCSRCGAALTSDDQLREERKVISVLFADLVGFTSRAERMDVEDVRAMIAPYFALVRQR